MRRRSRSRLTRRSWLVTTASAALGRQLGEPVRLPRKVRLALIGLEGHTGEILQPLARLPEVELVAVCDPDGPRLEQTFAKRHPAARRYTDLERLLETERLDVAAVCGPNGGRAGRILACLKRNLHVIAEKPVALTRDELARIRTSVTGSRLHLSMLLPMRFAGPYLALRRIVESGQIGEVVQIASQKSYKAGERPEWMRRRASFGGTIPWIGIHMIDLMRFTSLREFREVFSLKARIGFPQLGEMENVTGSLFALDNGGIATLRMDYLRPETAPTHGDDRLRLAGLEGIAEYQPATGVTLMTAKREPHVVTDLPPDGSVFVDFLESIYLGKAPALSIDDVFRVSEITLAAEEAAAEHRIVKI
jgi:predicted dehydrogenase